MTQFLLILILLSLSNTYSTGDNQKSETVLDLTPSIFDSMMHSSDHQNMFVKFYTPGCAYSQAIAPAWEGLAHKVNNYQTKSGSSAPSLLVIAQVDCYTHERWCATQFSSQLTGFPTMLYGDPSMGGIFLEEYQPDDIETTTTDILWDFVTSHKLLDAVICTAGNYQTCPTMTDAMRDRYDAYWKRGPDRLQQDIDSLHQQISQAKESFQANATILQETYNQLESEWEETKAASKQQIRLLKSLLPLLPQ